MSERPTEPRPASRGTWQLVCRSPYLVTFRNDDYLWWQVAEYGYDNFMIRTGTKT